ncbi:MAG: hypothetical protein KDD45_17000, partial [Bdellovibrionales bacterium]|nr:hypothetical protein [Bdellovibrionales bacterium]
MKRIIGLLFMVTFTSGVILTGCDDKKEASSKKYDSIIRNVDEVDYLIQQEMILRKSSEGDRDNIRKLLQDLRIGFSRLNNNPSDELGITLVKRAIRLIRYQQLLEGDKARFDLIINEAATALYEISSTYSIPLNIEWLLYSFRFSEDLENKGYISWPQGAWSVDWALDRSYVSVQDSNAQAYLISPNFDLRDVKRASFAIEHTININRNKRSTKDLDRREILKQSFHAKISTDYKGGDPSESVCGCHWIDVDLGELPSSKDFHTVESQRVDLSPFLGEKNVSIAFYYD